MSQGGLVGGGGSLGEDGVHLDALVPRAVEGAVDLVAVRQTQHALAAQDADAGHFALVARAVVQQHDALAL